MSWTLTKKLVQKRSRSGRSCWAGGRESWTSFASVVSQRRSYGHCLCDSVLHSSWDSNCVVLWSLRNAGRQPWSSGLAPVSRFHSSIPLSHSFPSLIGLLASVDVKQQKLTHYSYSLDISSSYFVTKPHQQTLLRRRAFQGKRNTVFTQSAEKHTLTINGNRVCAPMKERANESPSPLSLRRLDHRCY